MLTAGIICEYNPLHLGHMRHIEKTRSALGGDCAIICAMSGNFVQRGDFAVFSKHARAEAAIRCGADLVIELPLRYVLSSAEGFAFGAVMLLNCLGICDYISFGSESGKIEPLSEAAKALVSVESDKLLREWLEKGLSYAQARQKAAELLMGKPAEILKTPNNLLGIEYIKALNATGSQMRPFTIEREGGVHDGDDGLSGSALRKMLFEGKSPWHFVPDEALQVFKAEIDEGRGPVSAKACDTALLARLRGITDFSVLPGASGGLEGRLARYAATEATVEKIVEKTKTKRYAMARIRRALICACLGMTAQEAYAPAGYIRPLAMNKTGMKLLKEAGNRSNLPIITKPASAKKLPDSAREMFYKEAAATDFFVLAYPDSDMRFGGQEWQISPKII